MRRRSIVLAIVLGFIGSPALVDAHPRGGGEGPGGASPGRALSRRSGSSDGALLRLKAKQVHRLRELVSRHARRGGAPRGARLHQLCLLERELGVLSGKRSWIRAALTSCRRVVAGQSRYVRRDEVLLVVAKLELRLKHGERAADAAMDLLRTYPQSKLRCAALLLRAKVAEAAGLLEASVGPTGLVRRAYGAVFSAPSCQVSSAREERIQAHYGWAWALIRAGKPEMGAGELRQLLRAEHPNRRFARRVLRDLAAVWATHGVPAWAWTILTRWASPAEAGRLAARVAEGILGRRRLPELLRFCAEGRRRLGAGAVALDRLRLRGFAELATAKLILAELRRWGPASDVLRSARARALLAAARRYATQAKTDPAPRLSADALMLYRLVAKRYAGSGMASRAELWLAKRARSGGELELAAGHLQRALHGAPRALRADIAYGKLEIFERLMARRRAADLLALRRRWIADAGDFITRYRGDRRRPDVEVSRVDVLADLGLHARCLAAAKAFLAAHGEHPGAARVRAQALVAARRLMKYGEMYALAMAAPRRGPPGMRPWRAWAAEAALGRGEELAKRGRGGSFDALLSAETWARRATALASGATLRKAWLLLALLAARRGDAPRLGRLGRKVLAAAPRRERLALEGLLARWHLALGSFEAAAALELSGIALERRSEDQIARRIEAARAYLAARRPTLVAPLLRSLRRDLLSDPAPSLKLGRAILAVGALLTSASQTRRAYGFYIQRAETLWRTRPRLAAACLLRAVPLSPSSRRAERLAREAIALLPRLHRGGRVDALAARARLVLVETWRRRGWTVALARPRDSGMSLRSMERTLTRLDALYRPLVPVLALRHARYSAAAGLSIAWLLGQMAKTLSEARAALPGRQGSRLAKVLHGRAEALRARRLVLLRSLARLARREKSLNRYTLAAARAALGPARFVAEADALPPRRPSNAALLGLLAGKRNRLALRLTGQALALFGARADLLCIRAIASLRIGHVAAAVADLREARRLGDRVLGGTAVSLNLAAIAIWRGAPQDARQILARLKLASGLPREAGPEMTRLRRVLTADLGSRRGH